MASRYFAVEIDESKLTDEQLAGDGVWGALLSALEHFDIPSYVVELKYNPFEGIEEETV